MCPINLQTTSTITESSHSTLSIYINYQLIMYSFLLWRNHSKKGVRWCSFHAVSMQYHHFMNNVSGDVRHLQLFCDLCVGQKKNFTHIKFFDLLVHTKKNNNFDSVKIYFSWAGHSYMECDREMGLINTKPSMSVPSDWVDIFKSARKEPSPTMGLK